MTLMREVTKQIKFSKGYKHFKRDKFFGKFSRKVWLFNRPAKVDYIINRKQYL